MIPAMPNRLEEARQQIEAGEPVDWNRLAQLQSLDLAIFNQQLVIEHLQRQEQVDDRLEQLFTL